MSLPAKLPCSRCGEVISLFAARCPECGAYPWAESMYCPDCNGEGEIETYDPAKVTPVSVSPPWETTTCRTCSGRGSVAARYLEEREAAAAEFRRRRGEETEDV